MDSKNIDIKDLVSRLQLGKGVVSLSTRANKLVSELAKGFCTGRIDHELRPALQALLSELANYLSVRELELLKESFLQNKNYKIDKNIQGVITALLKDCFQDLEKSALTVVSKFSLNEGLSASPDSSQAVLLGILRDLALELTKFLEKSEADGIVNLKEMLDLSISKLNQRIEGMQLNQQIVKVAELFLLKVSAAVFYDKLEFVLNDYLASGTDYAFVSGKVWASRYSRADYLPFLFEPLASLESQHPWLFNKTQLAVKIPALQVQAKAASLRSERHISFLPNLERKSLEALFIELKVLFGIGLNSLVKQNGSIAIQFFDRVLTVSADALEHPEQKNLVVSQKLSRIRVQAYFCRAQAEVCIANEKISKLTPRESSKQAKTVYEKRSIQIKENLKKARYELELLGLSGLEIDLSGNKHATLEGLSDWANRVVLEQETQLLFDLAFSLGLYTEAHAQLVKTFTILLGMEFWESQKFLELNDKIKINLKTGAETRRFWRTKEFKVYSESLVQDCCQRIKDLSPETRERAVHIIVLQIAAAFEFENFDLGMSLAVAHRYLLNNILQHIPSSPSFELLYGMLDAEVRFRLGLIQSQLSGPKQSALSVLKECHEREFKGYFRDIDRKREMRLITSAETISNFQAVKELYDYKESQLLKEGVRGQFVSQEIRTLRSVAMQKDRKSFSKEISNLAVYRSEQRLKIEKEEISFFIKHYLGKDNPNLNPESYLRVLNIESRAIAGIQVLLDSSLSCLVLQDEKHSRFLLKQARERYSIILPGLSQLIDFITSAQSLEEFRRRVEGAIQHIAENSSGGEISIAGAESGASLGFMLSSITNLPLIFDRFYQAASVSRRKIVPGRCRPLQRYFISFSWAQMQRRALSVILCLNELSLEKDRIRQSA